MPDTDSSKTPVSKTPVSETSDSKAPGPAVLRFRGLDLEAMTALQLRNIDGIRRMAELIFDGALSITESQAAFFKTGAEKTAAISAGGDAPLDPAAIFDRQNQAYRELFSALATQAGEFAEMTSRCCTGLVQEPSGKPADTGKGENPAAQKAERAGCCGGKGKTAVATADSTANARTAARSAAKHAAKKAADSYKPQPGL